MAKRRNPARFLFVFVCCILLLQACQFRNQAGNDTPAGISISADDTQPFSFETGRNDYVIDVDGVQREFIVYVPGGYQADAPTPVVFMFHGSNQHPETMYNNTTWVEKAEQENFIVIFPGSWAYQLIGEPGLQEKWNSREMYMMVEPGTELQDDVGFIRVVVDRVRATFNVDENRIFASGFSNGSDFVLTRMAPELNDVFAAFSTAGAGPYPQGSGNEPASPEIVTSIYSIFGTEDAKIAEGTGVTLPFPFTEEEILNDPLFAYTFQRATAMLNLENAYTLESESTFTRFTFDQSLVGADNEYIFMMILGMGHVYPNGENNRANADAADLFWDFFVRHPGP